MDILARLKESILESLLLARDTPETERRFCGRARCEIEVFCESISGEAFPAVLSDFGCNGIRLRVPHQMEKGRYLMVAPLTGAAIPVKTRYTVNKIKAQVVWCRKRRKDSGFTMGLKFEETRQILKKSWIYCLLSTYGMETSHTYQRRKSVRISAELPVRYSEPKGHYSGTGRLVDLGMGGAGLMVNQKIDRGVKLDLEIGPVGKLPVLRAGGEVAWTGFSRREKTPVVGICFTGLSRNQAGILGRYARTLLREQMDQ